MSETKHTPGPWRIELRGGDKYLYGAEPEQSALMCDMSYYPWTPDTDADWHLIAAAPDLLAALKAMLSEYGDVGDESILAEDEPQHPVIMARAAVDKAEGR